MERKLEHIDNLFREGLGSYTEAPPPSVWDALEERLDNNDKKRPGFYYRRYWFIILLAFFGVGGGSLMAWRMSSPATMTADARQATGGEVIPPASNTAPDTDREAVAANTTKTTENAASVSKPVAKNSSSSHGKQHSTVTSDDTRLAATPATLAADNTNNTATLSKKADRPTIEMEHAIAMNTNDVSEHADDMPSPKTTVIKYIVKNSTHHNIAVAESEPVIVNVREAHVDNTISNPVEDEDDVTFGNNISQPKTVQHIAKYANNVYATAANSNTSKRQVAAKAIAGTQNSTTIVSVSDAGKTAKVKTTNTVTVKQNTAITADKAATAHVETKEARKAYIAVANKEKAANVTTPAPKETAKQEMPMASFAKKSEEVKVAKSTPEVKKNASNEIGSTIVAVNSLKKVNIKSQNTTPPAPLSTYSSGNTKNVTSKTIEATATTHVGAVAQNASASIDEQKATTPSVKATKSPKEVKATVAKVIATQSIASVAKATPAAKEKVTKNDRKTGVAKVGADEAIKEQSPQVTAELAAEGNTRVKTAKHTTKKPTAQPIAKNDDKETDEPVMPVAKKKQPKADKDNHRKGTTPAIASNKTTKGSKQEPTELSALSSKTSAKAQEAKATATEPVLAAAAKQAQPGPKPAEAQVKAEDAPKVTNAARPDSAIAAKPADSQPVAANDDKSSKEKKHTFMGFEVGVKAGYEGGFNNNAAQKFVVSPFLERKLSSKLSLLLQPGIKYAGLQTKKLDGIQSFYEVDPNSTKIIAEKYLIVVHNGDTIWRVDETIVEDHDSIVKSYSLGRSYLEVEMPIMVKYNLTKKLSVYGGANLTYSKQIGIKENTWNSGPISKTASTFYITPDPPPAVSTVMQYSGAPVSGYNGPLYPSPSGGSVRLGYMLGFSYQFNKKWLADVLMQQGNAKANVQGGYNVNTALSSTYFRFTLGYKLFQ